MLTIPLTEEEESRQLLELEREELRGEVAGLEEETTAYREQVAGLQEQLASLRRTMEVELELQRSRQSAKLEEMLDELAGSTLRFSRWVLLL